MCTALKDCNWGMIKKPSCDLWPFQFETELEKKLASRIDAHRVGYKTGPFSETLTNIANINLIKPKSRKFSQHYGPPPHIFL